MTFIVARDDAVVTLCTTAFGLAPERKSIKSTFFADARDGGDGRAVSCGLYGAVTGFLGRPRSSLKISVGLGGSLEGGSFWFALREASVRKVDRGGEKPMRPVDVGGVVLDISSWREIKFGGDGKGMGSLP